MPTEVIGRAITDIRTMHGRFDSPEAQGECSVLRGSVPASELGDYSTQLAAYTQGRGQLQLTLQGYEPCHNREAVVASFGYDPTADLENTPDSVFCDHGAGFIVPWNKVKDYMHLSAGLKAERPQVLTANLDPGGKALEAILQKQFGPRKTVLYKPAAPAPAEEKLTIRPPRPQYYIIDGYNVIFAWEDTAQTARHDLDAARRQLLDRIAGFAAFQKCRTVVVFDGYNRKGSPGEKQGGETMSVVFTQEGETADSYIEQLAAQVGPNYNVHVVSSDGLVQLGSLRSGVLRLSARELLLEVTEAEKEMKRHFKK